MKIWNLYCPNCKKDVEADPRYEDDEFYLCVECGKPLGYHCSNCGKFYTDLGRLIPHGDLYVCKGCGMPQYGFTDWIRSQSK